MFEFVTRWLVCLVLLAVVVKSERTIKDMSNNLFEEGLRYILRESNQWKMNFTAR